MVPKANEGRTGTERKKESGAQLRVKAVRHTIFERVGDPKSKRGLKGRKDKNGRKKRAE